MTSALITMPTAARRAGITRQSMHKAAREGRIKSVTVGRNYAVTEAELSRFIKKREKRRI